MGNTTGGKSRYPQPGDHPPCPVHTILCPGICPAGEQARHLIVFGKVPAVAPVPQLPDVYFHDRRQQGSARHTMRHREHPSQGSRKPMHRAQLYAGQCHSAQQGRHRQAFTRFAVAAVVKGCDQRTGNPAHPFAAKHIYKRIRLVRHERFQKVGKGIHSRGSRDVRRDRNRQLRVDHCHIREHLWTAQAHFHPVFRRMDHRISGHLRSGTCSGRNGNKGKRITFELPALPDHLQVPGYFAPVGHQCRNGLGSIQHTASTQSDNHVAFHSPGDLNSTVNDGNRRF